MVNIGIYYMGEYVYVNGELGNFLQIEEIFGICGCIWIFALMIGGAGDIGGPSADSQVIMVKNMDGW